MNHVISEQTYWQQVLRRQSQANAQYWLTLLEDTTDPAALIVAHYDSLLRAVEILLQDETAFNLLYRLLDVLYMSAYNAGDWDRWLVYLQKALTVSQKLGYTSEEARLIDLTGDLLVQKGDFKGAADAFRTSIANYLEQGNLSRYSNTLSKLATLYGSQGQATQAINLCQEALRVSKRINDELMTAQINLSLSIIYFQMREWPMALASAQRAHLYFKNVNNYPFMLKALTNMANNLIWLQEWERATNVIHEAIGIATQLNDLQTLVTLRIGSGVIAYKQTHYLTAEAAWQEALRLNSQLQEPGGQAAIYNNLGMVYTKLGEWAVAEEMLRQALAIYEFSGSTYQWANSMDNLADLYEAKGDTAIFRRVLQEAIARLETANDGAHCDELLTTMRRRLDQLPPD
ncbi:MAG: tetratricopeptide repeat protein [Chloroflexi bacterium]|nr:tetratricopeptide repeat protein [Chloroflexota bacterium]MCI0578640.1 tetratricopeptide repeat protein [Chloroflexota bacterium]MCI0647213.1 tetratricopeptide repeat protein [Chloroflexota bacterium]MCI0728939.1 tetratricopeptide repeat protein [Chloroflexota bacterium]